MNNGIFGNQLGATFEASATVSAPSSSEIVNVSGGGGGSGPSATVDCSGFDAQGCQCLQQQAQWCMKGWMDVALRAGPFKAIEVLLKGSKQCEASARESCLKDMQKRQAAAAAVSAATSAAQQLAEKAASATQVQAINLKGYRECPCPPGHPFYPKSSALCCSAKSTVSPAVIEASKPIDWKLIGIGAVAIVAAAVVISKRK